MNRNESKLLKSQVENLKGILEEEMTKRNNDIKMLESELGSLRNKDRENMHRLNQIERDNELLKEESRRLRKELQTARSDADVMMKMMDNYENEKINFKKKEDMLIKKEKELKEIYNNSKIELDKAKLKEESYEKSMRDCYDRT